MALAYGSGIALALAGSFSQPALLLLPFLILPIWPWHRPVAVSLPVLTVVLAAGIWAGGSGLSARAEDCRFSLPTDGWEGQVSGRFESRVVPGRSVPFRVEGGLPEGCTETVLARWPHAMAPPSTGALVVGLATWQGRGFPDPKQPLRAGLLRFQDQPDPPQGADRAGAARSAGLRGLEIRGRIQDRILELWGAQAPMVEALVLARREHLDPDLRAAFGISGTAHLLAISGFHVGVMAGLLLAGLRLLGLGPRPSAVGAALGSWIYVLGIGAPDAALRAATVLTFLATSRLRGIPVVSLGVLSSAFLLLLLLDPLALESIGFQLSFAGTLGLVTLRSHLLRWQEAQWISLGGRPFTHRAEGADFSRAWLRGSSEGLAAGIAATIPTLPLLAWHFDRVSLIGVLATLLVAPGVSLAIPGILGTLILSAVSPELAAFLAGGVGWILEGVALAVRWAAAMPGAAPWISRPALVASGLGAGLSFLLTGRLRPLWMRSVRTPIRGLLALLMGWSLAIVVPLIPWNRHLEVHVMDVGQGEAIGIRFPDGRWMLVDAGPSSPGWDAGSRTVLPYLRRQGVRRLEALVLTHAHLDHIGGAPAILRGLPVRGVLEPARVTASAPYLATLREAEARGVSWWQAQAGDPLHVPGMEVRVLHPPPPATEDLPAGPRGDPNQVSVVLLLRWGAGAVLLTGDAYTPVEQAILRELPPLTVLKLGHHGSRTSTSAALLAQTRPTLAVVSLADGNRYGHPHREVLERLQDAHVPLLRTDRDGHLRILVTRHGKVRMGR